MQRSKGANESDPRTVAAAASKQNNIKFPVCPKRCHSREGLKNAADRAVLRGGAAFVTPTTFAPHTMHCHGLPMHPSRICKPEPVCT